MRSRVARTNDDRRRLRDFAHFFVLLHDFLYPSLTNARGVQQHIWVFHGTRIGGGGSRRQSSSRVNNHQREYTKHAPQETWFAYFCSSFILLIRMGSIQNWRRLARCDARKSVLFSEALAFCNAMFQCDGKV